MPNYKVFTAHLGFYDTVLAAPSRKEALAIWRAPANTFTNGFAEETRDAALTKLATAMPRVVFKRMHGSKAKFKPDPDWAK